MPAGTPSLAGASESALRLGTIRREAGSSHRREPETREGPVPTTIEALVIVALVLSPAYVLIRISRQGIAHVEESTDVRFLLTIQPVERGGGLGMARETARRSRVEPPGRHAPMAAPAREPAGNAFLPLRLCDNRASPGRARVPGAGHPSMPNGDSRGSANERGS